MSMKETFLCPGLVVRLPYKVADEVRYTYVVIEYVWSRAVDVRNLKTGVQYMESVSSIRGDGVLVGQNFKTKI